MVFRQPGLREPFGEVETEQQKELITLANDLYDECIQEVRSQLRAAVACTNAYRFDLAEQVLTRWQRYRSRRWGSNWRAKCSPGNVVNWLRLPGELKRR